MNEELIATLQKIKEIADSTAKKLTDVGAKQQVERIAGLAESALNKGQEQPDKTSKEEEV